MFARRATFLLTIPTSAPDLPSHGEALYLTDNIGPTSVGVNTFNTIVLLTLITNCDGGASSASSSASSCVPQPSKQLLNACPIPPVHVIVTLLAGCQSAILSSNEWHNDMNPALISTIMAPNFEIKEITSGMRSPYPSQMKQLLMSWGQGANPYNVAQHINGNSPNVDHVPGKVKQGRYQHR